MSTPSASRLAFSIASALAFRRCCSCICCTASLWFPAFWFSARRRLNSLVCSFCTARRSFTALAALVSSPAAAAAARRCHCWKESKMACASFISFTFNKSPIIRPASSTLASSYSATSANRLIILGLMVSCTFISTSSHSALSMLAAPSTPAALAAPRNNSAAPCFVPPMLRVSFTMASYSSAGFPSRCPSSCRSFTPCFRASATASLQLPYWRTSSALALPFLSTV